MNNKDKKGMTLDKLAGMVSRRFDEIEGKMATKADLHALERKVDKLDYQVSEVYDILKHFEENDILNLQPVSATSGAVVV